MFSCCLHVILNYRTLRVLRFEYLTYPLSISLLFASVNMSKYEQTSGKLQMNPQMVLLLSFHAQSPDNNLFCGFNKFISILGTFTFLRTSRELNHACLVWKQYEMKRASSFVFPSFSKHTGQIKQEIKTGPLRKKKISTNQIMFRQYIQIHGHWKDLRLSAKYIIATLKPCITDVQCD